MFIASNHLEHIATEIDIYSIKSMEKAFNG